MNFNSITTIDFETKAISGALPPMPVGVAIKYGEAPSQYFAWGHPSGNNCTKEEATRRLKDASMGTCLYHNNLFDDAVGLQHLGVPHARDLHDTLLLLYLRDPHAKTLSLKPSADELLGMAPVEKDILTEWIVKHVGCTEKKAGAHIAEAPVELVAPYACGDTDRTFELFKHLHIQYSGKAYDRERALSPILVDNTLQGIRINASKLEADYAYYKAYHNTVTNAVYKYLKATPFNIDSAEELADAIDASGIPADWVYTAKTGKRSTSKPNMEKAIVDAKFKLLLGYRSTLSTYLETFYTSWLDKQQNGRIHFSWNQVRNQEQESGKFMGTRTGRLSSTPSMLNVPKAPPEFDPEFLKEFGLVPLPKMRSYLLPDEDQEWLDRDYSSQELRLLAHYDDDAMMRAYNADPRMDLHQMMSDKLTSMLGKQVTRRAAKTIAFSILYGSGTAALAEGLGCSESEAKSIKAAYFVGLPGVKGVQNAIKKAWDVGDPIKTWGGRYYHKEPSKMIKDKRTGAERWADFTYKGLNYLIQGSAADVTKQAIINYHNIKKDGRFLLTVHDQIDISGPRSEMALLREAMLDIAADVPMISDAKIGANFGELNEYID